MGTLWSIINILKALYQISVSDQLKEELYFQHELSKHLRSIIYQGNDVEKEYSIMLLWQLCFNKKVASAVLDDVELYLFIEKLGKQTTSSDVSGANETSGLRKNASGVIWVLNKSKGEETAKANAEGSGILMAKSATPKEQTPILPPDIDIEEINRKHIMISYNRDSRDLCLRIKQELENDGRSVWIDVEDISGSSLESMANAIENSVSFKNLTNFLISYFLTANLYVFLGLCAYVHDREV